MLVNYISDKRNMINVNTMSKDYASEEKSATFNMLMTFAKIMFVKINKNAPKGTLTPAYIILLVKPCRAYH